MSSPDDAIRQGLALQQAGQWPEALVVYLRLIAEHPAEARGHFLAGVAEAHCQRLPLAAQRLRESLRLNPAFAEAAQALGGVHLAMGDHRAAVTALGDAQRLAPQSPSVAYELGAAHLGLKQFAAARTAYERAVELKPDFADAHNNLGNLLKNEKRLETAEAAYQRAIEASPTHLQAWYNLGIVRQLREKPAEAIQAYQEALRLAPHNPAAENNLGIVLRAEHRTDEAIEAFRRALELNPNYEKAMTNLGPALQEKNHLDEALAVLEKAVAVAPKDANAHCSLGNVLVAMNRPAEGIAAYRRAEALKPGLPEIDYNIALAQLVLGDYANGWSGYDTRTNAPRFVERYRFLKPRWSGREPLEGKTILLFAEQGLGDTLHFLRYVPLVAAQAKRVVLRIQQALKPLLTQLPANVLVQTPEDGMPSYDLQCPLMSLPLAFATTVETIPGKEAYLTAPAAKLEAWRKVFGRAPGLKIGLVWSGNPKHQYDHNRSISLRDFVRITDGVPAHFFAIQKDIRIEDSRTLLEFPAITDLSRQISDFTDTAGIVGALDLVIAVDTSVAHLAGALGQKTWTLVSFAPDWRWLLGRTDSPWYPSMQLFRQADPGSWSSVIADLNRELKSVAGVAQGR